jgi:phosphotransferase system enzyme I (PtsI)
MCGEMAGDPFHIPVLLGMGINELSMNPQAIPAVKNTIRSLRLDDAEKLMKDILKKSTAKEVVDLLQKTYGTNSSDDLCAA